MREIRKNADDRYLVIAGNPDDSNASFGLYVGRRPRRPARAERHADVGRGRRRLWGHRLGARPAGQRLAVELLEDNGATAWHGDELTSKTGLPVARRRRTLVA